MVKALMTEKTYYKIKKTEKQKFFWRENGYNRVCWCVIKLLHTILFIKVHKRIFLGNWKNQKDFIETYTKFSIVKKGDESIVQKILQLKKVLIKKERSVRMIKKKIRNQKDFIEVYTRILNY